MNAYEQLQDYACNNGVDVIDYHFQNDSIKGLYCDGTAAIRKNIDTVTEKACILAEELGHHHTSSGNILDQTDTNNRKQELRARMWAYNELIGLRGITKAYEHGCSSMFDMAEYLEVTEEYLKEALNAYRNKYGICADIDNYTICFIPYLAVFKKV